MTARALYFSTGSPGSSTPLKVGTQLKRAEQQDDPVQAQHLLRRATYGATPAAVAEIAAVGTGAWLEGQLNPGTLPDPDGDAVTALFPKLAYSPPQVRANLTAFSGELLYDFLGNTIGRSVWSSRQLHELMVAFWNDHLHIAGAYYDSWDSRHRYDLDVIRPHALGSFAQMLQAATRHPAMLRYLDQSNSKASSLNENLGRELLELHTVGAYTEADVLASSRMLTGLSINESTGEFVYRSSYHYVGALTIGSFTHANTAKDGQAALTAYLDHLARHPQTAARIARKLAVRFVSDEPSAALVSLLARVYLENDTQIAPVLRVLFTSVDFQVAVGAKVRTPQEDVYAQLRALGFGRPTSGTELEQLYWSLSLTGHGPMDWAPPNGFPDSPSHWATPTTALARLTLHINLAAGWWPKFTGYPTVNGTASLLALVPTPLPASYGDLVQALARRLLFGTVSHQVRDAICGYFGKNAADPVKSTHAILTWQLPHLVALLFDSPAHLVR